MVYEHYYEQGKRAGKEEESTQAYNAGLADGVIRGRNEVVDWGSEPCKEHQIGNQIQFKRECKLCWKNILKEWGL